MTTDRFSQETLRDKEEFYRRSNEAWENASGDINEDRMQRMQRDIMSRISAVDGVREQKGRKRRKIVWLSAAAASIALIFGTGGYFAARHADKEVFYKVVAENGQKSTVSLPDGSSVKLNSGSSICYSSHFNRDNRNITLEGEAYFDVAKNPDVPFVVYAKEMAVTALGTKFNVRAYDNDSRIVATLVQGRIKTEADGDYRIINANNSVTYDKLTQTLVTEKVYDTDIAIAWTENRIFFDNESLEEIAQRLERLYDIDVVFNDDKCKSQRFNGRVRNNSLENILSLISSTSDVSSRFDGNTVEFSTKR